MHSLPAALLFRPFSFYTRGQGQTQVKLSDLHKDDLPEVKVTEENGHQVTSDTGVTPGITLTSDSGSQHTLEGKPGTTYSKLEEAEESHVTSECDEAVKQQELHPLVLSDSEKQVTDLCDAVEMSNLNNNIIKLSMSVSALNDCKAKTEGLMKAASHSNIDHQKPKSSYVSLHRMRLRSRRSLHTSTASLSVLEFQDLPPDVMQLQQEQMVRIFIYKHKEILL